MVPLPVPDAGESVNQPVVSLADQARVPPPTLLMLNIWVVGLALPCWAIKDRLAGLTPTTGLTGGTTGAEGGVISCANPGNSAANLLIDRPPPLPPPDDEELPAPTAANGMVPVGAVPAAMEPVAVAGNGTALMVARGTAAPMFLLSEEGSLGCEVELSLCKDDGGVGKDLVCEEPAGEGSTDATGAFCGFRISRCGLLVKVCASFVSKDFAGNRRMGAIFSNRRPCVPTSSVSWLTGLVSC